MLLDTCALLWLSQGGGRLTRRAIEIIEFAPELYISAISGFEIGIKCQKGKLTLPLPANEWFEIVVEHHDLSILTLDLNTCIAATDLPPIHKDPCDRFIIASAKLYDTPVVTSDEIFIEYGVDVIF